MSQRAIGRPIINGSLQPFRTSLRSTFDPTKGYVVTEEWETAGDNLTGTAQSYRAIGASYDWNISPVRSKLVATTINNAGFGDGANAVWQLYTNEQQKDIRESAKALALGPHAIAGIEADIKQLKEFQTGEDMLEAYTILTGPDTVYSEFPDQKDLLDLMLHGVTSYNITGYAARATISLPFAYTGELPSVSPDSLMARLIADIPVGGPNDGMKFKWGWRRNGTSRTFSGLSRTEIHPEWWLSSWSKFLYEDITDLPA